MFSLLILSLLSGTTLAGILSPQGSPTRDIRSLDGLWNFSWNSTDSRKWYQVDFKAAAAAADLEVQLAPVPSSYNDLTTKWELRDQVGPVWYQRTFFVPKAWDGERVWIRFASVCREAEVWINGKKVVSHDIGHLPFQAEISSVVNYGKENTIKVSVDNTLLKTSIPPGRYHTLLSGRRAQTYTFDFFNYAGIDRPVVLYTTPQTYIDDISVTTDIDGNDGTINYSISIEGSDSVTPKVTLYDQTKKQITSETVLEGNFLVEGANFWWPFLVDPNPGYLYSLQIQLFDDSDKLVDSYRLPVGIRTISWDSTSLKINNKPVYLRGFARHEDTYFKGSGLDLPTILRDYNLMKWIGGNTLRTSYFPYPEEIMEMADKYGIMIIDESPAVDIENIVDELLDNHKKALTELIERDKNHPSVIMWSATNEPTTESEEAADYFKEIIDHIKSLDKTRPVTVISNQTPGKDYSGQYVDIASINVAYSFDGNAGNNDIIVPKMLDFVHKWNKTYNVPVLVTEYGADTLEGLHILPSFVWSEEYHEDFLGNYFQAFDQLRDEGLLIGEMSWFADYRTQQNNQKVGGDKRGVFTRNRQPKAGAHLLRKRYWALAENLNNAEIPEDLDTYVFTTNIVKDEL